MLGRSNNVARETAKKDGFPTYHITAVDINLTTIARTIIMFVLLDKLSNTEEGSNEQDVLSTTLAYSFAAAIMPPYVIDELEEAVRESITALEDPQHDFVTCLYVPQCQRKAIVDLLKRWQKVSREQDAVLSTAASSRTAICFRYGLIN